MIWLIGAYQGMSETELVGGRGEVGRHIAPLNSNLHE